MSLAASMQRGLGPVWRRAARPLAALALGLALAAVFAAYLNPHLVADLANRVWACF